MNYAIEVLQKEYDLINKPLKELNAWKNTQIYIKGKKRSQTNY